MAVEYSEVIEKELDAGLKSILSEEEVTKWLDNFVTEEIYVRIFKSESDSSEVREIFDTENVRDLLSTYILNKFQESPQLVLLIITTVIADNAFIKDFEGIKKHTDETIFKMTDSIRSDINSRFSNMSEKLGDFSYQDFSTKLNQFTVRADSLNSLLTTLSTKDSLRYELRILRQEISSNVASQDNLDQLRVEICGDRNGRGGLITEGVRNLHGRINSFLSHRFDRFERKSNQNFHRFEEKHDKAIDGIKAELTGFQRYAPSVLSAVTTAIALYLAWTSASASLTGFVGGLVEKDITPNLQKELGKEGGIETRLGQVEDQVNQNTEILNQNAESIKNIEQNIEILKNLLEK